MSGRKLSRPASERKAMLECMVISLLVHERITTTVAKAKELRGEVDRMITLGKRGDLHARRQALSSIRDRDVVHKLFADIAERNRDRPGGYTRIMKTGFRHGDGAPMSVIELVERVAKVEEKGSAAAS